MKKIACSHAPKDFCIKDHTDVERFKSVLPCCIPCEKCGKGIRTDKELNMGKALTGQKLDDAIMEHMTGVHKATT